MYSKVLDRWDVEHMQKCLKHVSNKNNKDTPSEMSNGVRHGYRVKDVSVTMESTRSTGKKERFWK